MNPGIRKDFRGFSVMRELCMEHMIKSMYLVTGNCSQKILSKNENKKYPELLVKFRVSHFLGGKLSYNVNVNSLKTTVALSGIEGNFLAIL